MFSLRTFLAKVRGFFRGSAREVELDAELQSHLELLEQENLRKGMSGEEARQAARRQFGGIEKAKELYREQQGLPFLSVLLQDVRFALRLFTKNPALSVVIIAILAVGIGAGTAIYSLIDACLLHSTTYPVVDRWEVVRAYSQERKAFINYLSTPEILEVKQLTDVFEDVGAVHGDGFTLSAGEFPERVGGTWVSANAVTMTEVAPVLGHTFREEEDRPGGPSVVLLSYELWQNRFASNPQIVGQTIWVNGVARTVIGVMPAHYDLWGGQLWVPLQLDPSNTNRSDRRNWIVALLRKGVTERQADARLRVLAAQLKERFGTAIPEYQDWDLRVWNINEAVIGGVKPALLLLAGAVTLLILVTCANAAILLMARATSRWREMAIRRALGAGVPRIVRQMLTESVLLSLIAGAIGVCIAIGTLPLLVHLIPHIWLPTTPEQVRVNFAALAVACAIAATMGILFGMAPALQLSRQDFVESLKEGGTRLSGDRQGRVARNGFVTAEIAISVVILAGSALMLQSYRRLQNIDLGFHPDHVLSLGISLDDTRNLSSVQIQQFFQRALQSVASLPSVEAAATVSGLPMVDRTVDLASRDFTIEGRPTEDARVSENANFRIISPDYFRTMGVRLLKGRAFTDQDGPNAPRTVIINEAMAKLYWPKGDAIGRRILPGRGYGRREMYASTIVNDPPLTIVGVVSDVKQTRVIEAPVRPEFYLAFAQQSDPPHTVSLLVRSELNPADLTAAIRSAVHSIDPNQPVYSVVPMPVIVADSFGPKRLTLFLLAFLTGVVLILSSAGLYAALSYSVSLRRHEIGIRLALGASRRDIGRMIVNHGAFLAACGLVVGLAAALALTRLMQGLLYGISATDPLTLALSVAVLFGIALAACYLPARRATRVDPLVALRHE